MSISRFILPTWNTNNFTLLISGFKMPENTSDQDIFTHTGKFIYSLTYSFIRVVVYLFGIGSFVRLGNMGRHHGNDIIDVAFLVVGLKPPVNAMGQNFFSTA